jgi:hypothetical protein
MNYDFPNVGLHGLEITMIKEPTMLDVEWHSRLFAIAAVRPYTRAGVSHTYLAPYTSLVLPYIPRSFNNPNNGVNQ